MSEQTYNTDYTPNTRERLAVKKYDLDKDGKFTISDVTRALDYLAMNQEQQDFLKEANSCYENVNSISDITTMLNLLSKMRSTTTNNQTNAQNYSFVLNAPNTETVTVLPASSITLCLSNYNMTHGYDYFYCTKTDSIPLYPNIEVVVKESGSIIAEMSLSETVSDWVDEVAVEPATAPQTTPQTEASGTIIKSDTDPGTINNTRHSGDGGTQYVWEPEVTAATDYKSVLNNLLTIASKEIGYHEKASGEITNTDDDTINTLFIQDNDANGSANIQKYAWDLKNRGPQNNTQWEHFGASYEAWCSCFVVWCLWRLAGGASGIEEQSETERQAAFNRTLSLFGKLKSRQSRAVDYPMGPDNLFGDLNQSRAVNPAFEISQDEYDEYIKNRGVKNWDNYIIQDKKAYYVPSPGDILFETKSKNPDSGGKGNNFYYIYYKDEKNKGIHLHRNGHAGIVESVKLVYTSNGKLDIQNSRVYTIEGNMGDSVKYKTDRPIWNGNINCYGTPFYEFISVQDARIGPGINPTTEQA